MKAMSRESFLKLHENYSNAYNILLSLNHPSEVSKREVQIYGYFLGSLCDAWPEVFKCKGVHDCHKRSVNSHYTNKGDRK